MLKCSCSWVVDFRWYMFLVLVCYISFAVFTNTMPRVYVLLDHYLTFSPSDAFIEFAQIFTSKSAKSNISTHHFFLLWPAPSRCSITVLYPSPSQCISSTYTTQKTPQNENNKYHVPFVLHLLQPASNVTNPSSFNRGATFHLQSKQTSKPYHLSHHYSISATKYLQHPSSLNHIHPIQCVLINQTYHRYYSHFKYPIPS